MNKPISRFEPAARVRFSTADFQRMIETGAFENMWVELIEGEIERMPPPGNQHSARQVDLIAALLSSLSKALIRSDVGIDLGDDTLLGCDAVVLNQPVSGKGALTPDQIALIVEIAVSTRERDLSFKRRRYAAAGIPTYWVIDEERSVIHVFDRPEGGDYLGIDLVRFGAPLPVPGGNGTITLG
ncbi:Uma2 family endonuclease [Sphingomonas sp.]|uniref:Uma2 family endonuclease n=1 Tax=Sphingomonas sp. TaxID=28214 RepID=UPI0035C8337E